MDQHRLKWIAITLGVVLGAALVTYMVAVASPEAMMEPGDRSAAHQGIDCLRCHEAYSGTEDDRCLECHDDVLDLVWHSKAGGDENCVECHYEHVDRDYITDHSKVPAHPAREIELSGVHAPLQCRECHFAAVTEGECADCHERYIEGTHLVGYTSDCDQCHIQSVWDVDYDHLHEKADCLDCHGTDQDHALPGYLEHSTDCSACHGVDLWLIPEFDHEAVNLTDSPCQQCHPSSLDVTWAGRSGDCADCHMDTSWTPQRVDHLKIDPPCLRCHEEDLPTKHIDDRRMAPMDCEGCHQPGVSWARQIQHIQHPQPCIQCHGETPEVHDTVYADDCQWCHVTDSRDILKPHPDQTAECTDCHVPEHAGGDPGRSVDTAHALECSMCHVAGVDWTLSAVDHDRLGGDCYACHEATHAPIGGLEVACGACHHTAYWLPVLVDHDAFSEDCVACHLTTHPNGRDRFSDECTLCHGTDDWSARTWDHDLANASGIQCVMCHDDIHRGTLGLACEECHTTDTWETEVINP